MFCRGGRLTVSGFILQRADVFVDRSPAHPSRACARGEEFYTFTPLGIAFLKACRKPAPNQAATSDRIALLDSIFYRSRNMPPRPPGMGMESQCNEIPFLFDAAEKEWSTAELLSALRIGISPRSRLQRNPKPSSRGGVVD